MSNVSSLLISDARMTLIRQLQNATSGDDAVERQFARVILSKSKLNINIATDLEDAVKASGAKRTYKHVSILGFARWAGLLEDSVNPALLDGLHWIFGRAPVVDGVQMPFCRDAVALLGMAVGVAAVADNEVKKKAADWLQTVIHAGSRDRGFEPCEKCFLSVISELLQTTIHINLECSADVEADIRVGLRTCGLLSIPSDSNVMRHDQYRALELIKSETAPKIDIVRAALRLVALESIMANQPILEVCSISKKNVADLLRRFQFALKLWTWEDRPRTKGAKESRRWQIDNEYHVQNLLWFLLSPLFPDLSEEEYTPKVGPIQPRADLGIPSLRLIIEAKFMRDNDPPKKVINEIAQDASLYLTQGSRYDSIIAVIWDDSRRGELYEELISGLRAIDGVDDAIIVARPGKMVN